MIRWRAAALLAAAALLGSPAAAAAAPDLETGAEDERLLLDSPGDAARVVSAWAAAGIDVVRIHARWNRIAPTRRGGRDDWTELDRAIPLVRAAGMRVAVTVTGPGPLWTSRRPSLHNPRYKPDPRAFGRFARAVAARYGDHVDRYLIWNEPNIAGWLDPQLRCRGRRCTPLAPHLYRGLVQAAAPAIRDADPGAEILVGELAPIGRRPRSARSGIAPLTFLRAMGCVDDRYRRLRSGPCRRFRPVVADALGHHPHGVNDPPARRSRNRNWAKFGDLDRLVAVIDRLRRKGVLVTPGRRPMPIHMTEFGYQTSPPDHAIGITLAQQDRWLQQAAYLSWRHPRVKSLVHYQWEDEPVRFRRPGSLAYAGWQSGLHYVDGRPKPAATSFLSPFVIDAPRGRFWGQIRPGDATEVTVLRDGEPIARVRTDARGFWTLDRSPEAGRVYRVTWTPPGGGPYALPRTSPPAVRTGR